jgi:ubiquinone/menaquinone biosynthesis C-methylase UbiE
MDPIEIISRYSMLANSECCLSCGGAINYAGVTEGEICVDLGSGRGTDVLRMAESAGETGFVYGIDISDGMIEKARLNAEKFNVRNVRFVRCGLEKIELPDMLADLVISNCTINHANDKNAVWEEIYRILKNQGRFVVSDIYSINVVPDEYKNDPIAISECWAGSVTRKEYLNQLKNAGFSTVRIIEESEPYTKGQIKVASWTLAATKNSLE